MPLRGKRATSSRHAVSTGTATLSVTVVMRSATFSQIPVRGDPPEGSPRARGSLPPMRTLVTGGGGFLGSHLVERLEGDGYDVGVARRADHDLTSMEDTARLFDEFAPELVFHLAAEVGGIGANRANPGRYWYANLMMGAHVLEQARLHGTRKLVMVGTVCSYPKDTPVPFRED